jgi:hypothetical protein
MDRLELEDAYDLAAPIAWMPTRKTQRGGRTGFSGAVYMASGDISQLAHMSEALNPTRTSLLRRARALKGANKFTDEQ